MPVLKLISRDREPFVSTKAYFPLSKRLLDIALSFVGLILFSPLAVVFALAVKLEDRGPVLYAQERWGRTGRKFKAYKFRTMVPGADGKWGLAPARENDRRVTRIGKFLRGTAMDELPQLINILKGQMSFVGPRALSVHEVSPTVPGFTERHRVPPGLTGPAQIFASRDAPFEEKLRYDLEYARHQNFWADLKLICVSVWISVRGKWESREKKI